VDPLLLIENTVEHVGLQELVAKDPTAPAGSPEALKLIGCELPDIKVAVTVVVVDPPGVIERSPELESA